MASFRTTITVPQDLKERMDAVPVDVNWSAVAARAFEEKLAEIASRKERHEMSDFIRVLGPDPENKRCRTYQYVHRGIFCKAVPIYAVEEDGKFFDCTPTHPKAKLVSYRLIDTNGVHYSCGNPRELQRLGLVLGQKQGRIGFMQTDGKKLEFDRIEDENP